MASAHVFPLIGAPLKGDATGEHNYRMEPLKGDATGEHNYY